MYYATKTHVVTYVTEDGRNMEFDLYKQHTLSKKFDIVFGPVNLILEKHKDFKLEYDEYLYLLFNPTPENLKEVVIRTPDIFKKISDLAEEENLLIFDYEAPPSSKKDVFRLHINREEYKTIMMASIRSRFVCAPITQYRQTGEHIHIRRFLMEYTCMEMTKAGTTFKLNQIIESTVMQTSMQALDNRSKLWNVLINSQAKDPYIVGTEERNGIFYKGLPTIQPGRDPIKWLVSMVRTSVKFMMQDKMDRINISVSVPIDSSISGGMDILKMFVYEEVTTNRQLVKLYGKLDPDFVSELSTQYVYPVSHFLAVPFTSLVFDIDNLNTARMSNTVLLNLFTHEFMKDAEKGWSIFDYLLTYARPRRRGLNAKTDMDSFTNRELSVMVRDTSRLLGFEKTSTYTLKQIESVGKTLKEFFDYEYIGEKGKIDVNPKVFVGEYLAYIHGLSIGKYSEQVTAAKDYIRTQDTMKKFKGEDGEFNE